MQLVAVAVGRTREVEIQGALTRTAYLKSEVEGPCFVDYGGPVGNETAVHPDTVYAIAVEHYAYWAGRLRAEARDWRYGYFAENLTIRGLAEQELHVGDVVRVGANLRLIVTGPRIPCFKVAWRMQRPQSFVREFAASGRTGVYFAVLEPGTVSPGDNVQVVHRETDNPTVFEIGAIARGERSVSTAELQRLLALPYLSKTSALLLKGIFYRMLDQPDHERRWDGWRDFFVTDVRDEADDVKSFELRAADGGRLPRFAAGQFVPVRLQNAAGEEFVRPWSLSHYSRDPQHFRITVKREDRGAASATLHREVRRGSILQLRPPSGEFKLDRSSAMPLVLVAAGIGVTPLMAMALAHLDRGPEAPPLRFIHCVRNGKTRALGSEIAALAAADSRFKSHVIYSQPATEDRPSSRFSAGRLTADALIAALDDLEIELAGKTIRVPWYEVDLYLCGPESFLHQITQGLLERGARRERLRTERFVPNAAMVDPNLSRDREAEVGVPEARVLFRRAGKEAVWLASQGQTLLDLGKSVGLLSDVPMSNPRGRSAIRVCTADCSRAGARVAVLCTPRVVRSGAGCLDGRPDADRPL
jgi:uncharacterized protein